MAGLQAACSDIPALTASTQDLHARVTEFLRDTRQHATQLSVLGTPVRPLPQVRVRCMRVNVLWWQGRGMEGEVHVRASGAHEALATEEFLHAALGVDLRGVGHRWGLKVFLGGGVAKGRGQEGGGECACVHVCPKHNAMWWCACTRLRVRTCRQLCKRAHEHAVVSA